MNQTFKFDEASKANMQTLMGELYETRNRIEASPKNTENLTFSITPCMVGENYGASPVRLLIYGQQANGWKRDSAASPDEFSEQYMRDLLACDGFRWIVEEDGVQTNGHGYQLDKSQFWVCSREIFKSLAGDVPADCRIWQECIAQSDTHKIGYEDTDSTHKNVTSWCRRFQHEISLEIVKAEIELLKPTHILFMTNDKEWFFNKMKQSLTSTAGGGRNYTRLKGYLNGAKVVVMRHPNYTNRDNYIKQCVEGFGSL